MSRSFLLLLFLSGFFLPAFGQLMTIPIAKEIDPKEQTKRTEDISLTLPFWDDFSDAPNESPKTELWLYGRSSWVNSGMGINPPSLNVATLDGLDSLGKPYNVNDILAKGFADKMVSHPIRMDLVDPGLRSSVFLSFYYQFQGNGEAPDPGDLLSLYFKNRSGVWERVWFVDNNGTLNKETFVQILVPINADRFFHDTFQFRFQNFARLSGPYDTWNIDYIYLNKGRSSFDNSYPDRAVATPLTSLFKSYHAVPVKHFFSNPANVISAPIFSVYNFRIGNNQPLNYFSYAELKTYKGNSTITSNLTLDNAQDIGSLIGLQRKTATLATLPPLASYDAQADSIQIKLSLTLTTKDNNLEGPPDNGDYDPSRYAPIDFRKNDVLTKSFTLARAYAYDDGSAEYGAGLNQPGALVAYQFDMVTTQPDTIVAFDLYFPRFGDESSQVIQLHLWQDLEGKTGTVLHQQALTVSRTGQNKFVRVPLSNFIGVKNRFFIGWRQSSSAIIAVGLDKSSNSGGAIFFNTNGVWEKNTTVSGNLMMRPVFGKGRGVITSVEPETIWAPYPNPTRGSFYLPPDATQISLIDLQGRSIAIDQSPQGEELLITLQQPVSGVYLIRYQSGRALVTKKIMVLEP